MLKRVAAILFLAAAYEVLVLEEWAPPILPSAAAAPAAKPDKWTQPWRDDPVRRQQLFDYLFEQQRKERESSQEKMEAWRRERQRVAEYRAAVLRNRTEAVRKAVFYALMVKELPTGGVDENGDELPLQDYSVEMEAFHLLFGEQIENAIGLGSISFRYKLCPSTST